jgi:hypothetical protein
MIFHFNNFYFLPLIIASTILNFIMICILFVVLVVDQDQFMEVIEEESSVSIDDQLLELEILAI